MTNEELNAIRTIMREEVGGLREEVGSVREEVGGLREEVGSVREEVGSLRGVMREEINAAVYASEQRIEQRMNERFETSEQRTNERFNRIEATIQPMGEHLILLRAAQRQLQSDVTQMQGDLSQALSVLDEATVAINELQAGQRALESKVDDHIGIYKRDIQKLTYLIQTVGRQAQEATMSLDMRMTLHEDTPVDRAHPQPPAPDSAV